MGAGERHPRSSLLRGGEDAGTAGVVTASLSDDDRIRHLEQVPLFSGFTKDELRLMLRGEHPEGLSAAAPIAIAHHLIRRWLGL